MRLDSIALAASALTIAVPVLHVDVDGDGLADTAGVSSGRLHVVTRSGDHSTAVPAHASLAGAMGVRGLHGVLVLVRIGSSRSVTDAVYRVTADGVRRVHVHGSAADALVQTGGSGSFTDFDCGRAPLTVDQISATPVGRRWDETVLTYALGVRGLVLQQVRRFSLSSQAAGIRRCAIVRR